MGEGKVKTIKRLGAVVPATLVVMAFAGVSPAMAESTSLCKTDQAVFSGGTYETTNDCPVGERIKQVHLATLAGAKAVVLNDKGVKVECDVLFSGEVVSLNNLGPTIAIEGFYSYSNCGNCTVKEVGKGATLALLREGHEKAKVVTSVEMEVKCGIINCKYLWAENGTALGPLLSTETNGDITFFEQPPIGTGGVFCPGVNKLDITMTPLVATYLAS
jgi:hypothetical protein